MLIRKQCPCQSSYTFLTLRRLLFVLAVIILSSFAGQRMAIGQSTTGSVQGIISDNTGAVVVGASVSIVSTQTGVAQKAATNASGVYLFSALLPGQYTVQVEKAGFANAAATGIVLQIDQKIKLDFALHVGAATESVRVNASGTVLQTQEASVGEVINQQFVRNLPTLGRTFLSLSLLSPGVVPGPSGSDDPTSNYSVNGSREFGNQVLIDGVISNSNRQQTVDILPSLESVQEFKVLTGSYNAETGDAGGAVTSIQTKSGTNEFHGDVYEFFRPPQTTANQYFSPIPTNYRQNNFGATIGGPIFKNKAFFFLSHEEQYGHSTSSFLSSVPPAGQIVYNPDGSVDLSRLLDPYTGKQVPLFNPYAYAQTGVLTPFPNNLIPANLVSKSGVAVLQMLYPAPNAPGLFNGYINNFITNQKNYSKNLLYDARFDYALSDKSRLSLIGHYSYLYGDASDPFAGKIPIQDGGFAEGENIYKAPNIVVALPWTYVFTNTLFNHFLLGYRNYFYNSKDPTDNRNLQQTLGFGNITVPGFSSTTGIPQMNFGGDLGAVGGSSYEPLIFRDSNWQVNDDLTKVVGRHQFKMGFQFRHLSSRPLYSTAPKGYFYVGGPYINQTGDPTQGGLYYNPSAFYATGGSDIADEILGIPYEVETGLQLNNPHTLAKVYSGYFQDTWRVTDSLTLNYGLRYDIFTPWIEQHNNAANFSLSTNELLIAGVGGNSRALVHQENRDFGPRFGVSYQVNNRTVVRAGYGLSYTPEDDARSQSNTFNYPYQLIQLYINGLANVPYAYLQDTGVPRSSTIPLTPGQSVIPISEIQNSKLNTLNEIDPHYPIGYVESYNLTLERQLRSQLTLTVGYVGDVSRHLGYSVGNLNYLQQISPDLGVVKGLSAVGTANYNSLQVKLNGRIGKGLDMLTSYTWGKSLGNTEPPLDATQGSSPQNPYDLAAEYGPDAADVTQVVSVAFLYQLPFGQGKRFLGDANALENSVLGGWQFNGIVSARTGLPFNVNDSRGVGKDLTLRPNQVGNPIPKGFKQNNDHWFDTSAFTDAGLTGLQPGNTSRNSLRGPDYNDVDFALFKVFAMPKDLKLQVRAEAFNAFNHPNFNVPNSNISAATVGTITSTAGSPRTMQFAAKFIF